MKRGLLSWRRAGLWLAMAAFALRLAVPAGFMLAPDSSNHLVVTLCSGAGPQTALLDLKTGEISPTKPADQQHKDGQNADPPCAFAGLAVAALTPAEAQIAAPLQQSAIAAATPAQARPALVSTGPPLPARGPPQLA